MKWINHYGCYKNKCIRFGSVNPFDFPHDGNYLYWKSGYVDPSSGMWAKRPSL